jgi:succinate dehydrogenase/fumarate reductase flavoprotein subunit
MKLDSRLPTGAIDTAWSRTKSSLKLVNPANKRKYSVIVVGSGLAGASAAASLAELGYQIQCFCFQDSPRRAHSIAAQGGINAAKNYQNDGDSTQITSRLLAVKGKRSAASFHRELGSILWDHCGMARNAQGLRQRTPIRSTGRGQYIREMKLMSKKISRTTSSLLLWQIVITLSQAARRRGIKRRQRSRSRLVTMRAALSSTPSATGSSYCGKVLDFPWDAQAS